MTLSAVTVTASDVGQWSQFLRDFPGAYRAFTDNRAALLKLAPYIEQKHPELRAQYGALVTRSNELAPKLATLKNMYDQVQAFFGTAGAVYQGAVDATSTAIEKIAGGIAAARRALGLGELGLAPIVLAIGAGAALLTIGAVVKWVTDTFMFSRKVNMAQELERRGYSPEQAADAVNRLLGKPEDPDGGIEQTLGRLAWVGGLAVLAWIFVPRLLDAMRARNA